MSDAGEQLYTGAYRIPTTITQDEKMKVAANIQCTKTYGLLTASCTDVVSDALLAAGLDPGYIPGTELLINIPRARYALVKANNDGTDVTAQITPTSKIYKAILNSNLATHLKKEVVKAYNATNGTEKSKPTDYTINIFSEDTEPTRLQNWQKHLKKLGCKLK